MTSRLGTGKRLTFFYGVSYYKYRSQLPFHLEKREGKPLLLVKLRQMGTQGVHLKGVLPWLIRWSYRAGTRDFLSCLGCFSWPSTIFFHHCTLFHFVCPHRPASWAGSRAGSPDYFHHNLPFECIDKSYKVLAQSLHIESFGSLWPILVLLIQSNRLQTFPF